MQGALLQSRDRHEDAARAFQQMGGDTEQAVMCLLQGHYWLQAASTVCMCPSFVYHCVGSPELCSARRTACGHWQSPSGSLTDVGVVE